jgi:ABC-type multidrug transport system fused ATPase/permease subunit
MRDFPPAVPGFTGTGEVAPAPGQPDTRTPLRFIWWILRQQGGVVLAGACVAVLWMMPGTLGPFLIGRAVEAGITGQSTSRLLLWSGLLLAVIIIGAGFGIVGHTWVVRSWLIALYRTTKLVARKTGQLGHVLPQRSPTGEVLSVSGSDSDQFGALTEVMSRAVGSLVSYLVVAGIVLSMSPVLGVMVLIAAPILVLVALPLLRPLQRRQTIERTRSSTLTGMATDIVAGLRILRGIGGERTFGENYAVQSQSVRQAGVASGMWQAVIDGTGVLFSGLFLVTLTWVGGTEVIHHQLNVGELISFFGYALFMVGPIQTFFELAQKWVRAMVSAAKTIAVLEQTTPWTPPASPKPLPTQGSLRDDRSGFVAEPGLLTMVVCSVPDESAALADRLGRYLVVDHDPLSMEVDEALKGRAVKKARAEADARRRERMAADRLASAGKWGVTVGDIDLADAELAEVRKHILVSDSRAFVFAGTLQEAIDPHAELSLAQAEQAMRTAAAEDVYDAVPGGWQGRLDEKGRGLSGGQRQRLILARALAADPEILILVEPTSAVDAHTEARIAGRLGPHRSGRTTVVMTASPLLLHYADRVALLEEGQIVAAGPHADLLIHEPRYRRVVARSMEEDDERDHSILGG